MVIILTKCGIIGLWNKIYRLEITAKIPAWQAKIIKWGIELKDTQLKVSYRDIAKMLCKAMPIDGQDFRDKVESYITSLQRLPKEQRLALKSAYIFSSKVPKEEREDMYQELALALLKAKATDERLAYSIARCDWLNWWKSYKLHSQFYSGSLNQAVTTDTGDSIEFGELLVGDCEFDRRMDGDLDGQALYEQLPDWVKKLVDKRLQGYPIRGGDRQLLNKWVRSRPTILASYQS